MDLLTIISPTLKVLLERVGKPEVGNLPAILQPGGSGAVIVCNHVGWVDSLWMAYAVYPRRLHYISKQELFGSRFVKWLLERSGSVAINREAPSPSVIKSLVDLLWGGEIVLIFPSGTRAQNKITFKRGAATIALQAQVPIIPAHYHGPAHIQLGHLIRRPHIQITFGQPISTATLPVDRNMANTLTSKIQVAIEEL